jgi:hypothetical protein
MKALRLRMGIRDWKKFINKFGVVVKEGTKTEVENSKDKLYLCHNFASRFFLFLVNKKYPFFKSSNILVKNNIFGLNSSRSNLNMLTETTQTKI